MLTHDLMSRWKRAAVESTKGQSMRLPVSQTAVGYAARAFLEAIADEELGNHNFLHPSSRTLVNRIFCDLDDFATPVTKRALRALNRTYEEMCDERDVRL